MGKHLDLTGNRYGRLVALEWVGFKSHSSLWLCKCDCGKLSVKRSVALKSGATRSCGCLSKESYIKSKRLYRIYYGMKNRCNDKNHDSYYLYGARGIKVDSRWNKFKEFQTWALNNGYKDNLTLERIDNNKGYSPENCKWITRSAQQSNTRRNVFVEINGERLTLAQAARKYNLNRNTVKARYRNGRRGSELIEVVKS